MAKTVKCPICKKNAAWVAWGHVTPCGDCLPVKINTAFNEPNGRKVKI